MVEQLPLLRQCVCSVLIRLIDSDDARPGRLLSIVPIEQLSPVLLCICLPHFYVFLSCYVEEAGVTYTSVTAIIFSDHWVISPLCICFFSLSLIIKPHRLSWPIFFADCHCWRRFRKFHRSGSTAAITAERSAVCRSALSLRFAGECALTAMPLLHALHHACACPQRLPLEFGMYIGAQAAEHNSWKPKLGARALHANNLRCIM
jgi:hypothetical protein